MKLSVVIAIYNESDEIFECVNSLLNQKRPADEILIVDNNCSDDSIDLIKNLPTVRVIAEKTQGIWPARHTGYENASGDILVCTDADARFPADWLMNIENNFHDERIIAVTSPGKFVSDNKLLNFYGEHSYMRAFFFTGWLAFTVKPLFGSNFALRKSVWKRVRGEVHSTSDRMHDDMDLTYHLLGKGKIHYDKSNFVYISTRTLTNVRRMVTQHKKAYVTVFSHWPRQFPPVLYWRILRGKM